MLVRIFLSMVSSEFRSYRHIMHTAMERSNVSIQTSEAFIASGMVTFSVLNDYITSCDAVVHLVGERVGRLVGPTSLDWLRQLYPNLAQDFPVLQSLLSGKEPSSYAHWEAYLAVIHKKPLLVAAPTADAVRDEAKPSSPDEARYQAAHLARLRAMGYYPQTTFRNPDQLVANLVTSQLFDLVLAAENQEKQATAQSPRPQNMPYASLGSLFKGRGETMRRLRERLQGELGDRVALLGLGGIGKTRLAVEYAWQYQSEYSALLFVQADTPASLEANLAALCEAQVLNLPEQRAQEHKVRLQAVLDWLAQHLSWLLILDNVDTLEAAKAVERYLPLLTSGHVLLTTRIGDWSRQVQRLELDVLPRIDAAEFLLEATKGARSDAPLTLTDAAEALALADELGQLPLALSQAGAYIETKHITLTAYRERWASNHQAVRTWSTNRLEGHPLSMAATWKASFEPLSPDTKIVLNRLAWLAAAPIPLALLGVAVPDTKPLDAEEALDELVRYSLASYVRDGLSFNIHSLVQRVTREELEELGQEAQQLSFFEALNWVDAAFTGNPQDVRNWAVLEPLRPHVLDVVQYAAVFGNPSPTSRLLNQVGQLLDAKAQLSEAEPLYRRALAINETTYGPNHPTVAIGLNNLAELLRVTNRLAEAEPLVRRALAIDEDSYGLDHPTIAVRLNNLAELLWATNRIAEAEPLYRRALAIDEASYGPQHPEVATDLNNLARLLEATNQLVEAEALMRQALAITETSYGPNHPVVATCLNNLASLLRATNRLDEAEPLFRRALAITEASYGPGHPAVARGLNNFAGLLRATNRLSEAEPLYRRALAIDEASYGPQHPEVATDLNNLAELLRVTDRLDEAERLFRRALAIDEASYGSDHPTVAARFNNLALLLQATDRLDEAERLFRYALAIGEASYGPHHPFVATCLNNLTLVLQDTNRLGEAEPLLRRALAITEASYGPNHPSMAVRLSNLAMLLQATNRLEEAEPLIRRALAIYEASHGPNHPLVAGRLSNLASLLQATKQLDEAEPLYRHALTINEVSYGPNHYSVARDLNNLASLLEATNRLHEAEPLYQRALGILVAFYHRTSHTHPDFQKAADNYIRLLRQVGQSDATIRAALAAFGLQMGGGEAAAAT
jgi:tetratricopeptide (TPR) repeat protein